MFNHNKRWFIQEQRWEDTTSCCIQDDWPSNTCQVHRKRRGFWNLRPYSNALLVKWETRSGSWCTKEQHDQIIESLSLPSEYTLPACFHTFCPNILIIIRTIISYLVFSYYYLFRSMDLQRGVVPLGSNGEYASLTYGEKVEVINWLFRSIIFSVLQQSSILNRIINNSAYLFGLLLRWLRWLWWLWL